MKDIIKVIHSETRGRTSHNTFGYFLINNRKEQPSWQYRKKDLMFETKDQKSKPAHSISGTIFLQTCRPLGTAVLLIHEEQNADSKRVLGTFIDAYE